MLTVFPACGWGRNAGTFAGKAVAGAQGVSCCRHFLSRLFLNYFYFFSPRFAVLRPAFACPFGRLPPRPALSTNSCVVSPQPPHRLWCTPLLPVFPKARHRFLLGVGLSDGGGPRIVGVGICVRIAVRIGVEVARLFTQSSLSAWHRAADRAAYPPVQGSAPYAAIPHGPGTRLRPASANE